VSTGTGVKRHDLRTFNLSELRVMRTRAQNWAGNPYPKEWIEEEIREQEDRFRARCKAVGYTDRDTDNTQKLTGDIIRILTDDDLDPYQPPELHHPTDVRLSRMVINKLQEEAKRTDKGLVAWLAELTETYPGASLIVADIIAKLEGGEHWKWMQEHAKELDA
jgi:hypothetical protein